MFLIREKQYKPDVSKRLVAILIQFWKEVNTVHNYVVNTYMQWYSRIYFSFCSHLS